MAMLRNLSRVKPNDLHCTMNPKYDYDLHSEA